MAANNSDIEYVQTKKFVDNWVKEYVNKIGVSKGQSLLIKHSEGKHTLIYDVLDSSKGNMVIHIAFMDILNTQGKSRLLNKEEYGVQVIVKDEFWDHTVAVLGNTVFKKALQAKFNNSKIGLNYRLEE